MTRWLRSNPWPVLLVALGLATRFASIHRPADVVWDEQHFGRFVAGYLKGQYFFDIHPPLGKLLIYAPLRLAGVTPPDDFEFSSSAPYPGGYRYGVGRLAPAAVGALLPLLIYLVARALTFSKRTAAAAGGMVLLDNALTCISHFTFIDVFLHAFIYAALLAFLHHRRSAPGSPAWWILLVMSGLAAGCAVSVKWTGAGILGVLAIAAFADWLGDRDGKALVRRAGVVGVSVGAVYVSLFAIHFAILPNSGRKWSNSHRGDDFMSERFRASLAGTAESRKAWLEPMAFAEKFAELNREMFYSNRRLQKRKPDGTLTHDDSSECYEWIAGRKRIWFWGGKDHRRIHLLPNYVVWFFGTLSLAGGLAFCATRRRAIGELIASAPEWKERFRSLGLLSLMWVAFFVPYIGISRPMFLYHYFTALIVSVLIGCLLVFEIVPAVGWKGGAERREPAPWMFWTLAGLAAANFLFVAPVTYGFRPWLQWQSAILP